MGTRLPLLAVLALAALAGGCGANASETSQTVIDPVELLAEEPALPKTYATAEGEKEVEWAPEGGNASVKLRTCESGRSAFSSWSDEGIEWGVPSVDHAVCAYDSEAEARDTYASQSLLEVGGEDWPNFEPNSEVDPVPAAAATSLDGLAADEWEIGCGIGEPVSGCAVWTFRARYGSVLTEVEFVASPGAIRFEQMRDLVASIDAPLAREIG